jgi:hypothetical protein
MTEPEVIDTGDTVFHERSGETWLVAQVRDDKVYWCGWPPGRADLSDCQLTKKATPEERQALLQELAKSKHEVSAWAYERIAEAKP